MYTGGYDYINLITMSDSFFGADFLLSPLFGENNGADLHPQPVQFKQSGCLIECLNNLRYPPCTISGHESEPLSMVCVDSKCPNRTLICALCESCSHYKHICVPLKYYLSEVYGGQAAEEKHFSLPVMQPETTVPKSKSKKNRNKGKLPIFNQNLPIGHKAGQSPLFYTSRMEQLKKQFLNSISQCRQQLLQKLHDLETVAIKYFSKITQETALLIAFEDPVQKIQKMMSSLQSSRSAESDSKDQEESKRFRRLQRQQAMRLKNYVGNILRVTKINQKFILCDKLQQIWLKTNQTGKELDKQLKDVQDQYEEQIDKMKDHLGVELKMDGIETQTVRNFDFQFSNQFKGHKFVVRNGNKVCEQTGMESSGQRFILLEPCLPNNSKIGTMKVQTWGIKLIKLVGWVGVGISLKNSIVNAKYCFNYNNIGHGSYLISANGYSWSHSAKQFNSASKCFSFASGDTIYIQYNIGEKKLTFYKNQNDAKFVLDIVEPPKDDDYCPSVNMCSSGDTVEIITQKPSFL